MDLSPKNFVIGIRAIIPYNDKIIIIKQKSKTRSVYLLPGGGLYKNEPIYQGVKREVLEELKIKVKPIKILYINQIISPYDNNIEFFILCKPEKGKVPKLGIDPERPINNQKLEKFIIISPQKLKTLKNFYPEKLKRILPKDFNENFSKNNFPIYLGVKYFSLKEYSKFF